MSTGNGSSKADDIKFVTKKIAISDIIFDKNNPNKMSEKQFIGLEKAIDRYGFSKDPWVNQQDNGKYLMIDGEHRVKALMKNNVKYVTCRVYNVIYAEVRMLRQVGNNLHGEHDKKKDIGEYEAILDNNLMAEFSEMLAKPLGFFEQMIENDNSIPGSNGSVDLDTNVVHRCIVKGCTHGQEN